MTAQIEIQSQLGKEVQSMSLDIKDMKLQLKTIEKCTTLETQSNKQIREQAQADFMRLAKKVSEMDENPGKAFNRLQKQVEEHKSVLDSGQMITRSEM